jgi:RNA polymerase sigma-70 factor (ECF subfamily)
MLEDKLLVLKCRHGNKDAMRRIYEKYKDYLLTLARGLQGDRADAEDIVHDVFVVFARSARQFQLTGSLRGYLVTCVVNRVRDKIRAQTRRAEADDTLSPTVCHSRSPVQIATESEQVVRLRQALRQLPYEQREAVILHIKGGVKFREIARLQGVSVSTTHGRYRYGLDKLRSLLNSEAEK